MAPIVAAMVTKLNEILCNEVDSCGVVLLAYNISKRPVHERESKSGMQDYVAYTAEAAYRP